MMLIRPIQLSDIEDLISLAEEGGIGVTTLPPKESLLLEKIQLSQQSFNKEIEEERAFYFFALEDTSSDKVVGVSAIDARVGLDDAWYNYRISTMVHSSKQLGVHQAIPTLYLSNDMTSCTEICSLLLTKDYRHSNNGQLLSKARFLFLADFPDLFSSKVFAEMRGYSDESGKSPFWEGLGRHFFSMEYSQADYLSGLGNKSFIAELMPKHPIYLPLLSDEAQGVVGRVHEHTQPALSMLEGEGFHFNGFIDIFDAGPLVESFVNNIRCVSDSVEKHAMVSRQPEATDGEIDRPFLVSNRQFSDFRVALVSGSCISEDTITLDKSLADALGVSSGESVKTVPLRSNKRGR